MQAKPKVRRVVVERRAFDALQLRLLREIAHEIKNALGAGGIAGEKARELTENLTSGIAAIIDGSRVMKLGGLAVEPVLTFRNDDADLIGAGGSSWMHEYANGMVEEIFAGPRKVGPRIWFLRLEFTEKRRGAYSIGVDMTKSEHAILDELSDDWKIIRQARRRGGEIAKVSLTGPNGLKKKLDARLLFAAGFDEAGLYGILKQADQAH